MEQEPADTARRRRCHTRFASLRTAVIKKQKPRERPLAETCRGPSAGMQVWVRGRLSVGEGGGLHGIGVQCRPFQVAEEEDTHQRLDRKRQHK